MVYSILSISEIILQTLLRRDIEVIARKKAISMHFGLVFIKKYDFNNLDYIINNFHMNHKGSHPLIRNTYNFETAHQKQAK
jgi:hypothetical protein